MGRRKNGNTIVFDFRDRSGTIQLRARTDGAEAGRATASIAEWDIGDIVSVTGGIYVTHQGKIGLEAEEGSLLAKALQRPPTTSEGLKRTGSRRELELIASPDCRNRVITRAAMIDALREWMRRHDFIEVETPILQLLAGGALARPFVAHHNALDREVSLRVSAELYLRRCTVGDLERVYDLGKCFRNEGMSRRHSPEFTMLEWSMAYSDYHDAAAFTEQLVAYIAERALGSLKISHGELVLSLIPPWRRVTLRDAIKETTSLDIFAASPRELLDAVPIELTSSVSWSDAVRTLYGRCVEPHLAQPTIVYDFPLDTHPCLRQHSTQIELGESFDVVIGGVEVGSGGTEINDPDEQWDRFIEQRNAGSGQTDGHEPHPNDREYVTALRYGAPPSSGVGIGIDRLLMVLLDTDSIQKVVAFPTPR